MRLSLSKKPLILGFSAGLFLFGFYFLILSLVQSFSHALEQFTQLWYWILILVVGFGLQVGLYSFIREKIQERKTKSPTAVVVTSGGISTGSMIVCCLHHLVDVLPIIGLAALSLFLIKYQILFIVIGILSNIIGITIMLEIIQKNNLAGDFLKRILVYNMTRVKKLAIGLSLVLISITFFLINKPETKTNQLTSFPEQFQTESKPTINLPSKVDYQNGITFRVTPIDFGFENPVKFEIIIDTHSGSLDFDLVKISFLEDNRENKYQPLDWQGSPPGGHHLSGILIFPKIDNQTKKITFTIQDFPPRIFEWDLE